MNGTSMGRKWTSLRLQGTLVGHENLTNEKLGHENIIDEKLGHEWDFIGH